MFNLSTRIQTAGNQALTLSAVLAGIVVVLLLFQLWRDAVWLIDAVEIANIKLTTTLKKLFQYGSIGGRPKENNKISFDLELDLTPLFNWNTKQVFIYLTASYNSTDGGELKVTYWDKILRTKDDAKLKLKNAKSKYSVWDVQDSFDGTPAVVKLEWNIQPWIGPLIYGETTTTATFEFAQPKDKLAPKATKEKQGKKTEKKTKRVKKELAKKEPVE